MGSVWMSELSERSGVPVPTIKFYLREGLLHRGEAQGATRARYDERHVERLRLIRALVDIAGLSLERVKDVVEVVADESVPVGRSIGFAHQHLAAEPRTAPSETATARVEALLAEREWGLDASAHAVALAEALDQLDAAGQPLADDALGSYADAMTRVAETDLASLGDARDAMGAAAYVVTGTLLVEPVLISLRRIAQEALWLRGREQRG